jgi:hypothetical protein
MDEAEARTREALAYYHEFRAQIRSDLNDYESGTHYTGEIRDGKRIDTTPQTIAELKRRLVNTDKLITAYQGLLRA